VRQCVHTRQIVHIKLGGISQTITTKLTKHHNSHTYVLKWNNVFNVLCILTIFKENSLPNEVCANAMGYMFDQNLENTVYIRPLRENLNCKLETVNAHNNIGT